MKSYYKNGKKLKLCMSMIACKSEEVIERVILSWKPHVSDVIILLNNSNVETEEILIRLGAKIYKHNFIGFAETRNLCLSYCKGYDYNFHIDDSYELVGDLSDIVKFKKEVLNLLIKSENLEYPSARVIPRYNKAKYVGEIHEVLDISAVETLKSCFINDIDNAQNEKRTIERLLYDYEILKNLKDPRSKYYRAMVSYRLYSLEKCGFDQLINDLEDRINCVEGNLEENFLCCIFLAGQKEEIALKTLIKASLLFPLRAAEPFFFIYELTGSLYYLDKAYNYSLNCVENDNFKYFCVPVNKKLYYEVIPEAWSKKLTSKLL